MKKNNIITLISVAVIIVIAIIIAFVLFSHQNKQSSKSTTNVTTELWVSTENLQKEHASDGLHDITESEKTTKESQSSMSGVSQKNPEEWKTLYLNFVNDEETNPQYTNSEFKYAFVECFNFKHPVMLLKDAWNMYLFYIDNNKVVSAKEKSGDDLALHRMSDAYTENGELYMYGACGSPKAFYYCQVKHKDYFYLEYFAEGHYTPEGNVAYHQNGNPLTEEEYNDAVSLRMKNATTVEFV